MEEQELKLFFYKILRGVEYLHANKVIHRDIKLDNILLDEALQPKLCDFGISSVVEEGRRSWTPAAPPPTSPPRSSRPRARSAKSDVLESGRPLDLLNFGTVPFKSSDMQNLYCKILVGTFKFLEYDDVSLEALDVIKRMLVVDVGARLSLDGVLKHRWSRDLPAKELAECDVPPKGSEEIDQAALRYLVEIGFHEDYVRQSVEMGAFNHLKAVMDCLRNRFRRRGRRGLVFRSGFKLKRGSEGREGAGGGQGFGVWGLGFGVWGARCN
jgi:serine/threonine protein kinase